MGSTISCRDALDLSARCRCACSRPSVGSPPSLWRSPRLACWRRGWISSCWYSRNLGKDVDEVGGGGLLGSPASRSDREDCDCPLLGRPLGFDFIVSLSGRGREGARVAQSAIRGTR